MATALNVEEPLCLPPDTENENVSIGTNHTVSVDEKAKRESQHSSDSTESCTDAEQIIEAVLRDTCDMIGDNVEEGENNEENNIRASYVQEQAAAFDYFQKINGVQQLGRNVPGAIENETSSESGDPENLEREHLQLVERLQELAGDMFLVDDVLLEELMDLVPVADRENLRKTVSKPSYPIGESANTDCQVCFETKELKRRPCCGVAVCVTCLLTFIKTQVSQGIVEITCVECNKCIPRDEIMDKLDKKTKDKFYKFLVDANKEPHIKTCPQCSHIMKLNDPQSIHKQKVKKHGLRVYCESCSLEWCFPCQAPWHEGITCYDYTKGDKLLKVWAKEHQFGQANAQKCPKCKVYIQRSTGCDHMTCSRCKTNFCYKCGERFRELRFIGDHYSKLSVFGCKYRFKPHNPGQRRFIRGAILGGKIMAAPVIGGLALGAGAILLGVGVVVLPFYGGYKLHTRIKRAKKAKNNLRYRMEWMKRIEEMRQKGDPYLESWRHMREIELERHRRGHDVISGPLSGPLSYDLPLDGFVSNLCSTRRQSVDLNVDSTSIDSDTVSFCSRTELEDTLAVAQIDAYIPDNISTSSENSHCAACFDADFSNAYSLDTSLYYDESDENLNDELGEFVSKNEFSDCTDNPAGTCEAMQIDGPKECCNTLNKNSLSRLSGETSNLKEHEKVKRSFRKSRSYKMNDV